MIQKNQSGTANEISLTRVYDAPLKTVWDAWADPKQAAKWWGPRGFTITTHGKDLRSGGNWTYTMHGPDGTDFPNKTVYLEVEKYSRMVYDHGADGDRPPMFRVTVNFVELKGKTQMEMSMALPNVEAAQRTKNYIKKAGGDACWDRLAEYLDETTKGKDTFVINRSFDTDINTLFDLWTNPQHFAKWMGPAGSTMEFIRADIKQGGSTFYKMVATGNLEMWGRAKYLELRKPNRLVYTQQFTDENEKISRHPLAPIWPETMLTTVTLAEEGKDQTRVTLEWEIYGESTQEERQAFHAAKAGMTQGWTGSFDKLEEYLDAQCLPKCQVHF